MSFTFDNASQRVLPRVIEALQRLQRNPDHLARERDQPYDGSPPPYTELRETTQPRSPGPPVVRDKVQEQWRLSEIRNKSLPLNQFRSQAKREEERLDIQMYEDQRGRRGILPFDEATDYGANAENNVRARWVEQGIWGEEWGPAWPRGIRPLGNGGAPAPSYDGPFYGSYSLANSDLRPGCRWGHEQGDTPSPSPSPPPPPPPPPQNPDAFIFVPWSRTPSPPPSPRPRFQVARVLPDDTVIIKIPKPTVRDPEASRPLPQFLYQVDKEREWIKYGTNTFNTPGRTVNLDYLAYESVKKNWIKDGIWSPKWDGELPGSSWYHEEPESWGAVEPQHAAPASTDPARRPPDLTTEDSQQQARRRQGSNDVPNDEADAPHAESPLGRQARDTLAQQAVAQDSRPSRSHGPHQSLRHATTTRPDHQDGTGPSNTQARRTRPKRGRSDDTAESEQPVPPPKRAKKSGGGKGRASAPNDGPVETTSDPREKPPAGRKIGVQGAGAMGSESNGVSQKGGTRRSARIANRQAQAEAAAAVANMTPTAPASSRPRAARKGKTTSSNKQVVMVPKNGKKSRSRR
ncbi:unnamed protein product [Clonostachys byssicola]|uniref:Uncharacterized protein n=1 Tax=Clonostachys byssicola TaxID=160290 RepID=A0A9N9UDL8_9HYPO|nr:unnamed protein product [Clonostachys byssicola]